MNVVTLDGWMGVLSVFLDKWIVWLWIQNSFFIFVPKFAKLGWFSLPSCPIVITEAAGWSDSEPAVIGYL